MIQANVIFNEIVRTYDETDDQQFILSAIKTIGNIRRSSIIDKDVLEDLLAKLNNFSKDEGIIPNNRLIEKTVSVE